MSAYSAERARAVVAEHGETMTLRRSTEATTISLKGKRLQGGTEEVAGSAVQQQLRVKLDPTNIEASAWTVKAVTPATIRTDSIVIGSRERSIKDVRPLYDGDTLALYELTVAG